MSQIRTKTVMGTIANPTQTFFAERSRRMSSNSERSTRTTRPSLSHTSPSTSFASSSRSGSTIRAETFSSSSASEEDEREESSRSSSRTSSFFDQFNRPTTSFPHPHKFLFPHHQRSNSANTIGSGTFVSPADSPALAQATAQTSSVLPPSFAQPSITAAPVGMTKNVGPHANSTFEWISDNRETATAHGSRPRRRASSEDHSPLYRSIPVENNIRPPTGYARQNQEYQSTAKKVASIPSHQLLSVIAGILIKLAEVNDKRSASHTEGHSNQITSSASDTSMDALMISGTQAADPKEKTLQPQTQNPRVDSSHMRHSGDHSGQKAKVLDYPHFAHRQAHLSSAASGAMQVLSKSLLTFHARCVPGISVEAYLLRIHKYCPASNHVFIAMLIYFDRLASFPQSPFCIDSCNIHRMIIASVAVAAKFFSDIFYTNSRYAKVGGLPLKELNALELNFLLLSDFHLSVSESEVYAYSRRILSCLPTRRSGKRDRQPTPAGDRQERLQESISQDRDDDSLDNGSASEGSTSEDETAASESLSMSGMTDVAIAGVDLRQAAQASKMQNGLSEE